MDEIANKPTYHILDTETAALSGGVVELAYLEVDSDLNILSEFVQRINPERPIDPGAQAIHGISDEDVKDCKTLAETCAAMDLRSISLVAHNASFDQRMISKSVEVRRSLCTLALAREYVKGTTNCKLATLQEELNLPKRESHSALGDVHTVRDLLLHILSVSGQPIETLFARQDKPRILTTMPIGKYKGELMLKVPRPYRAWLLEQPDLEKNLKYTLEKLVNL